jgi:hypothetical protein
MIMSTGVVASYAFGNWDSGMFPTRRWTCIGNAKKHSPNDDWYCTMGVMFYGVIMMLVLSVTVIYLRCIDVAATCDSCVLAWRSASFPTGSNLKRPNVIGACWNHFPPSHCHIVLYLQSIYNMCWWWCYMYHCLSCCVRTPSHDNTLSTACFHAFHDVGLCWTCHSHLLLLFCLCPCLTQSSMLGPP